VVVAEVGSASLIMKDKNSNRHQVIMSRRRCICHMRRPADML